MRDKNKIIKNFDKKNSGNIEYNKIKSKILKKYGKKNSEKIEDIKIKILKSFLRVKKFYINYNKKRESLKFDDIEEGKNRKKLFSNKYPQLINYLNYNNNIYEILINESTISKFYPSKDFIPLWLICLRVLSNLSNIKVSFQNIDKDIIIFEQEFQDKIKEIIKNNINNYNCNCEWILLICPNKIDFFEGKGKEYEKLFKLFNYLLSVYINLDDDNNKKDIYEILKQFFFGTFENIYLKGIKYFLAYDMKENNINREDINIYTLNDKISNIIQSINNKKVKEFNSNENFIKLKSIIEKNISYKKIIKKRLEEGVQQYEKYYNRKMIENATESDYKSMELICKRI